MVELAAWLAIGLECAVAMPAPHLAPASEHVLRQIEVLPLAFEENRGQTDPQVRFRARGVGYDALCTDAGVDVVLPAPDGPPASFRIRVGDAPDGAPPLAVDPLPGTTNYLIGDDPLLHIADIRTFARVKYAAVLPGIDLVYYGTHGQLEYDLIVAPGADPRRVRMSFDGVSALELSDAGDLVLHAGTARIEMRKPVAYQQIRGERRAVHARYALAEKGGVGFDVGPYDAEHPLVIDPILALSTSVWGSVVGVAVDAARNIYVAGSIQSAGLPATGGYQTQLAGTQDAYVAKLNPAGTGVVWATYLGARRASTSLSGIAVDGAGSAYVTGGTTSTAFPVTPNAYRTSGVTFVTKLTPAGNALAYSTFVTANVVSLAVDAAGNAYMTGTAGLLATTPGVYLPSPGTGSAPYAAKLNAGGTAMAYATYLAPGGNDTAHGIAVDRAGNAYVVGVARSATFPTVGPFQGTLRGATDAFVTKVNPMGTALVYSTLLGGSRDERGWAIATDAAGSAYVTGWTNSTDFPGTDDGFQPALGHTDSSLKIGFVAKLATSGSELAYASYFGGKWCLTATVHSCFGFFNADEGIDVGTSIAVDVMGYAYVGGYVTSTEFPLVDSMQSVSVDGDVWHMPMLAKVAPAGDRLVYSTVLGTKVQGGGVHQIAIDGAGGAVAVGYNGSTPFPLTPGAVVGGSSSVLFKVGSGRYPTTVRALANPVARATPVPLVADVLTPTPGAVVTFRDGANTLGTAVAVNGTATLVTTLTPGIHRITATSSADGLASPPHFQIVRGQ